LPHLNCITRFHKRDKAKSKHGDCHRLSQLACNIAMVAGKNRS
jgi:hypothetical protein